MLAGLFNIGGGALGGLMGRGQDRRERAWRKQIMELLGPQAAMGRTNQFYQQFLNSPAFTQAQRGAAARGNNLQNNLAASLGQRGLGTSGIGSIAPALARSAAGGQLGRVRTDAFGAAGAMAQNSLAAQIAGLQAMGPGGPSAMSRGLGGGIADFSQFLLNYQKPKV